MNDPESRHADYWNRIAEPYQAATRISIHDYHYGPLLPGDTELRLLPDRLEGLRALELGCGAGQNSIYLAGRGADCVALDIAEAQLRHGRALAAEAGVAVEYRIADLDALPVQELGLYDLVHSTYALPFAEHPDRVIRDCARLLRPDGRLLLTTSHPAYAGEWIELEPGEEGLFLRDYFHPPDEIRPAEDGHQGERSRFYPLSTVADWLHQSGFTIERLLEPEPLPIPAMTEDEIHRRIPYDSPDWRALYPILSAVPTVAVFSCRKAVGTLSR